MGTGRIAESLDITTSQGYIKPESRFSFSPIACHPLMITQVARF